MASEIIELSDQSDGEREVDFLDRRALLKPIVGRVIDALGGREGDYYVMGDEASGCLKDLKKLWRKDDTDDERTVARLFWEMRLLPNDLIPILLETAGKGLVEDKKAISCVDLMTAMTWPIDLAEELKELDEELDKGTDYTQLLQSHLHYKAVLLKPGVIQALFGIILPPLAKGMKERTERDGQIINVVLHLIRNLAFIKDLPANSHLSSDQAEFSNLQSKFIRALSDTSMLDLLLMIATNADNDPLFANWNTLVLEILYLFFRGVKPETLAADQEKQPAANLQRLLALEDRTRRELSRKATSRHSRFGTTISVKLNPNRRPPQTDDGASANEQPYSSSRSFVLHRQSAIHAESGSVMDMSKRQKHKKFNKLDDLGTQDNLSLEARITLQNLATEFMESCFNSFLSGLLKDIRSERPKITEKDNLRLLYVTKWFLEFFLNKRSKEQQAQSGQDKWNFGLVAEVTERSWIIWVLKRMREAVEEKPKLWNELQAGIECLTQLLLLIDKMSSSEITDPTLKEAADVLQQQLVYNGDVLDIALESLRSYKPGTQSLAYLDSSVVLAYALLRMLERWGKEKGDDTYVRKKVAKKKKGKGTTEEDGIPDVEEEIEDAEEVINETIFTFDAFESKFAHADITHTLLTYLARYREFSSSECMRRVVSLLHRQAIKAKAEGLFFNVSTLGLFKSILVDQKSLPLEQPYKDLINLINFILRQFFKALDNDPFLAVEAFFPKNRGNWKQYSSWEPEKKTHQRGRTVVDTRFPPDVVVKKGYTWSEQLGIVIASLVEAKQESLITWTTEILAFVIGQRSRIIEETDTVQHETSPADEDNDEASSTRRLEQPSAQAQAKIKDYLIPYTSDEQADAATKNPNLKLLFRLSKFYILDEDSEELEWYIPSAITIPDLQRTLNVIHKFLETPIDLDGERASSLLHKKRRRRRRRSPSPDSQSEGEPRRKTRKEKKKKEKEQYKSAQFIEDSDAEYGDMDAFLEREKLQREKASLAAASVSLNRPSNMKATGTKKRRRKGEIASASKKRKEAPTSDEDKADSSDSDVAIDPEGNQPNSAHRPKPRPRPRPSLGRKNPSSPRSTMPLSSPKISPVHDSQLASEAPRDLDEDVEFHPAALHRQSAKRLILSDDED